MEDIGLALGGGSLRGAAHIGVLKALMKRGMKVTHLAGTSAGAIVAGLYACGVSPWRMEETFRDLSIRKMLDLKIGKQGFTGQRIYDKLLQLTDGRHFSDLSIPLAVVCVDLVSGQLVVIQTGEIAAALRASIAIPGVLAPVERENQLLVDGYVLNNNPADVVKSMGASYVVAVEVSRLPKQRSDHVFSHLSRYLSIASQHLTAQQLKEYADLVIDIDLSHIGRFEFSAFSETIQLGEREAHRLFEGDVPLVESVHAGEEMHNQAQPRPLVLSHAE